MGTYPNHGQEGASGTESDLSGWDTTGILRNVQSLDEYI
jgi:hypothetical protein